MGEDLVIFRDGDRVPIQNRRTATRITSARQNWALNADDTVSITVESPFPQNYFIGDRISVFGRDYKLNRLPSVQKTGMQEFRYDLEFEGTQYDLFRVCYDLTIDTTNNQLQDVVGDSLTGDLVRFMTVLVANANRVFPGKWVLGECPENTKGDTTLTFAESDNCLSVLQTLCQKFNKEFEIVTGENGVYIINIKTVGRDLPFTFQYGRGRGMYSLRRENVSNSNIITRLKVFGSTENITSKYRANRLCLPGKTKGQSFIEDERIVEKYGIWEGRKDFNEIKPSFTGSIDGVFGDNVLSFVDTSFPFDINETESDGKTTKYLLPESPARIHFNTGNLAGYEFDLTAYDHATHTFTIKKQVDERGDVFPSDTWEAFQFAVGDEYKVLNIAYSPEIERQAEVELEEAGMKFYQQNCQPRVQYGCNITKQFIERLVETEEGDAVNFFMPGDSIHIVDEDVDVDKPIRVKALERNILDPYDYGLTISDIAISTTITNRVISDLIDIEKIISINNLKDPARARANWRSSREVLNMVFDPEGDYYTEKIKPQSIDTICLSVGAKSMQFGLTNTVFQPNYQGNARRIVWKGGILTHYTINETEAVSWVLDDGDMTFSAANDSTAYYIYAKCQKNGEGGSIVFTAEQHKVDGDAMYYYFWIGVLNSVDMELHARSLSLTYGFTMINGRFIKTGRIQSADGETYFDLDAGEIGGRITFVQNDEQKTLEELAGETLENKNYIESTLPGILDVMNQQIDGKIETWFQSSDPSIDWNTADLKRAHVGDMWYNTTTKELKCFSASFVWNRVEDKDAISAYEAASQAQDTADGKRRVFTSTPYPPYDTGDLWAQGTGGDLMVCNRSRASGAFVSTDWGKAANYTSDVALNEFIENVFNNTISDIMNQLDGVIESWFGNGVPTLSNHPASEWTSASDKEKHLGDIFYNNDTGVGYRFSKDGSTYAWLEIRDAVASQALAAAAAAQDTADGKRRVFTNTPYPPYDVGDLWASGTFLKRCIRAKTAAQSYAANDWGNATNYTGDESLNNFINGVFADNISDLINQIDGKIDSWYTTSDPASAWTTNAVRDKHVGDMWYNSTAKLLKRYTKSGSTYSWVTIQNADAIAAAEAASRAQDTADGKRRVFTSTPYPPYDVGDLWAGGASSDLMRCKKARASGSYVASDWERATKYTDDSALTNFITNTYTAAINTLTDQIDGKIDTYFQTANPWQSWASGTEHTHVGDMWYNTSTGVLKVFGGTDNSDKWLEVTDQKAIDAYALASTAKDTADGKRRVFVATPYPPYDVGDLWVNGTDLKRCSTARASGSYIASDWVKAVSYDNTKTTIDGGIVTSGTIQVAGSESSILAGMTGQGTAATSIRFWAGAAYASRASAPFRVQQNGKVVMTDADISGKVTATSGSIGGFAIKSGQIGADNSDTTNGLCLMDSFARWRNGATQKTIVGAFALNGTNFNGHMYQSGDMGTVLNLEHAGGSNESTYKPKALNVVGNQKNVGKVAFFEKGYSGTAYSDSLQTWFGLTHKFHFTYCYTSKLAVNLPTSTMVANQGATSDCIFDIEIVCDSCLNNSIVITSVANGYMYDHNGNSVPSVEMAKGDSMRLRYYNGRWTIVDRYY